MSEHTVRVTQPAREVVNADYSFEIFSDGEKLGQLDISKGTADWWPRSAQSATGISWEDFAHLLNAYHTDRVTLIASARAISDRS